MAAEDEALGHIRAHPTQADYSQFHRRFSFRGQIIPHAELQSMNLTARGIAAQVDSEHRRRRCFMAEKSPNACALIKASKV